MAATQTETKMPYVRLGNSGLKVSKIILGCMQYGDKGWQDWCLPQEEATQHIKAAYEAGIQTFDTSNVYSNGLSEVMLGNAIKELQLPRERIVIMTKVFAPVAKEYGTFAVGMQNRDEFINQWGLSRKHIFDSVQASMKRLQVDYIDLYQCHRFDKDTPIEETMQALHDIVKLGWVRCIGMSSCFAYQFHAMQNYAIANKLTPFISMQNHYNAVYREEEREMFPTLKMFGVGSIPWSPLARGLLTRPLSGSSTRGEVDWAIKRYHEGPGTETIIKRTEEIAQKRGISMAQVAIAWALSKEGVTAPIVGPTKLKYLDDIIAGLDVKLTDEEIKYIEEEYKPRTVFGQIE
ncbi:aryl-alcohol dehydrogenase [Coniophora puteana RWD-64-598 SS2]|uniref:Aryl-alcohol dehydrogenase n=1 Tax=Coniophora puteana (strain RWD-64-598) TaxID=741705 RepID=A0A5M3MXH7_CONPW|nr:aryl-alcohol dehydrogenase [Coniophora puteana RWD-64-598 SS2]EIW83790.1 aryl-alcohol dehydrogenase [Coniophora puteana RWD-64-598 SS2]